MSGPADGTTRAGGAMNAPARWRDHEPDRLMLPTIRADFALFETWDPADEAPLAVPMTVLAGTADRTVNPGQLEGWRSLTAAGCEIEVLPGDHFSMLSASDAVVELVRQRLRHLPGRVTVR